MDFLDLVGEVVDNDIDEFFFKYQTLQMFQLENIPIHVLQIDDTTFCIATKRRRGQNSELMKMKLPEALTLPPAQQGRSKDTNFQLLSVAYTGNLVYKIYKLERSDKLITSEYNVNGLWLYSFPVSSSGEDNNAQKLDVTPWVSPDFAVIQDTTMVICSKCCHEPLIQADVVAGRKVREIKHPFKSSVVSENSSSKHKTCCVNNNIKCEPLSVDSVAVLNTQTGEVLLQDLRSQDSFQSLPKNNSKTSKEIWTLSGCDYRESSLNYFGILSNTGGFCIYDKRKNSILTEKTGEKVPKEDFGRLKLKFNDKSEKISISGLDALVEVFQIKKNKCEKVFSHNGHCPNNPESCLTTDHIWFQAQGKEYIASVCDNGSLNCWNFNI